MRDEWRGKLEKTSVRRADVFYFFVTYTFTHFPANPRRFKNSDVFDGKDGTCGIQEDHRCLVRMLLGSGRLQDLDLYVESGD